MWACVSLLVTGSWHTLCGVKVEGQRKVCTDYSPKWESPGSVTVRQRPSQLCVKELQRIPPSQVDQVVTVRTQWSRWCVTNILQSLLRWNISEWGGAIISLGTAKPLRDLYLTRLAVWCIDTWGVCDARGFQEQCRGFATKAIDKTTVLLHASLLSDLLS